jgi:hypothetical protein
VASVSVIEACLVELLRVSNIERGRHPGAVTHRSLAGHSEALPPSLRSSRTFGAQLLAVPESSFIGHRDRARQRPHIQGDVIEIRGQRPNSSSVSPSKPARDDQAARTSSPTPVQFPTTGASAIRGLRPGTTPVGHRHSHVSEAPARVSPTV